jgi:hypothetical protein
MITVAGIFDSHRAAEVEEYARHGQDFAADEPVFRRGHGRGQEHPPGLANSARLEEQSGGQRETPPERRREQTEPDPTQPDADEGRSVSTEGLPPSADPANWIDHED